MTSVLKIKSYKNYSLKNIVLIKNRNSTVVIIGRYPIYDINKIVLSVYTSFVLQVKIFISKVHWQNIKINK